MLSLSLSLSLAHAFISGYESRDGTGAETGGAENETVGSNVYCILMIIYVHCTHMYIYVLWLIRRAYLGLIAQLKPAPPSPEGELKYLSMLSLIFKVELRR